jgi:L-fucose isomerase-like protein
MKRLRIGLVGLMHPNFRGDKEAIYLRTAAGLKELSVQWDFDLYTVTAGIFNGDDARRVKKELESENLDLLLVHSVQFASGKIIEVLGELPVALGLWAIPETESSGPLPQNSWCGMNMNASILGEYLGKRVFKWFYGWPEEEWFQTRFRITVRALQAIKEMRHTRMAIIGGISDGFDNQYYDERRVYDRFQVRIDRQLEFSDLKHRALAYPSADVRPLLEELAGSACAIHPLAENALENTARVCKALLDMAGEAGYAALTINCWPKFRQELGMVACSAVGYLNHAGLITACEGDVYGLLSMFLLRQLSPDPTVLMDLVAFDEGDQSVQFWHCGVGSPRLAERGRLWLNPHCNPSFKPGQGMVEMAPVTEMVYRPEAATIARLTREGEKLFLLDGEFFNPEKPSYDGSRGWLRALRLAREPITARDLVNTILVQRMQHHYAVGLGDHSKEMLEIAAWLGITPLEKVPYQDYLQI